MKVLHVATRFLDGGSERDIAFAIRHERRRGCDVHLATGQCDRGALPSGITHHSLPTLVRNPNPVADLRAMIAVRRLYARHRFDVVVSHQAKAGVVTRVALARAPVVRAHWIHMASFGPGYGPAASAMFAALEALAGRRTDVFACVGFELRDRYVERGIGSAEQFVVVRTPIDLAPFLAARTGRAKASARVRHDLGLAAGTKAILMVGSLEPRKRHPIAIRQLADALRRKDIALILAGSGPEEIRLRGLAHELGVGDSVRILGRVTNVPELMGGSDVLLHCSRAEGVPRVLIEAFASGTPVVATATEGLREIPGSPVVIVDRRGEGLEQALHGAAEQSLVRVDELTSWAPDAVNVQLDELWRSIEDVHVSRTMLSNLDGTSRG